MYGKFRAFRGAPTGHSRVPDVDDGRGATLWLFNIAMENCPLIDDFPSYKPPFILGIFHGYVSHNQTVSFGDCLGWSTRSGRELPRRTDVPWSKHGLFWHQRGIISHHLSGLTVDIHWHTISILRNPKKIGWMTAPHITSHVVSIGHAAQLQAPKEGVHFYPGDVPPANENRMDLDNLGGTPR